MKQYDLTVKVRVMKTLHLWVIRVMRAEAKIKFGQETSSEFLWCPFFHWSLSGQKTDEAPNVKKDFTPLIISPFFFMEI
jgi:hypothetical protein